ncbi:MULTISPECIES: hypothetical protein [Oscillatoriales]|uniref:Uncharacterized protein n=3 Tax=Limnospira TaxID=2596745 RepID=A0A9P1KF51_9CYAN|nr:MULTISPECIES: hypothetical protein [Oscillatoriales]AMW28663.1 hypothetical protein AP285_12500 [Arthrospira platensis YZ]MBD2671926.1 hypothetical protein [Arthrospira platensis FACHB-439]MBD2712971.1 hypothetical protein [Arthrospira platensis FACHB-835]MDC0839523.1 hypothetical protein [Limnoraphis robusta]MDY7053413.1 hypothetical protein [Limnospira fusiformis LS22]RAQ40264.1 hypothetical protein B9S53_16785 [Arthrospira sp. O9.13F]UWU49683.1 hypothetical protein APLC1_4552 [Arthrosp
MEIEPTKSIIFSSIVAVVGLFVNSSGVAYSQGSNPTVMFENVTLSPNFEPDPMILRGLSGGPVRSQDIAGREETPTGPCIGYVDQKPDHTLVLTEFFNHLSLTVQSNEDTVIVVRGPGGSWCNDDLIGMNPGIIGQWLSGRYEIWVGSYEPNSYHPYIIEITARRSSEN